MIGVYNNIVGGVNLNDRSLSSCRPSIQGNKWWFCLFSHGVNVTVVAAWLPHVSLVEMGLRPPLNLCPA